MESSRCSLLLTILACLCILKCLPEVDAHILVYRRLTNQLIEEYNDMPAQFGPSLSSAGIKVFVIPVLPNDLACEHIDPPPASNYPSKAKFAAIIKRGGNDCTFELKVRNAQAANFDAVIVYNNDTDDLEHMSAKNASGITIPAVFVGLTTGKNLRSFFTPEVVIVINDELPFNINTQLILPFSILIGVCFLIMIFYMIYKCIREERRSRRYRLPKRLLKKLPVVKITKNTDLGYDTCVICIDQFVEGDKVRILPCKHPYHCSCIDVWLTENKRECPICKRKVFTKREAGSHRNRRPLLDSLPDTDDDTRPLLQESPQSSVNTLNTSNTSTISTTRHGTFRRGATDDGNLNNNLESGASAGDITTDDENMLASPARRINPFDRLPNLPPRLAEQLDNGPATRSVWSWPVLRWFRRPRVISIAAPPYQEDILNDVLAGMTATDAFAEANEANTQNQPRRNQTIANSSSNNILNPSLSGSFINSNDEGDDDFRSLNQNTTANDGDVDSVFIQTPTQGGIAVAALPRVTLEPPSERLPFSDFRFGDILY